MMEGVKCFEAQLELGSTLNSLLYYFLIRVRETESAWTQVYLLQRTWASIQRTVLFRISDTQWGSIGDERLKISQSRKNTYSGFQGTPLGLGIYMGLRKTCYCGGTHLWWKRPLWSSDIESCMKSKTVRFYLAKPTVEVVHHLWLVTVFPKIKTVFLSQKIRLVIYRNPFVLPPSQ